MRLLNASPAETVDIIREMNQDSEVLNDQMIEICWYMRGAIDWDTAMDVITYRDRRRLIKYIEALIKRVNEGKMPNI